MDQNHSFSSPQRQSPVAILLVIVNAVWSVLKQLWPFLIIILIGKRGGNFDTYFLIVSIVITLFSTIYSVIHYFRIYFYITDQELKYRSGLLSDKQLAIPFDKIQSVHFEQNILHKLFKVKKIIVDTAGSATQEFKIEALADAQAEDFKNRILSYKQKTVIGSDTEEMTVESTQSDSIPVEAPVILKLSLIDLFKAGLFQNHFKSVGIIIGAVWWVYFNLKDIGIDTEEYVRTRSIWSQALIYSLAIFLVIVFVSIVISVLATMINFFNLTLYRNKDGFKIIRGLFNVRTITVQDKKIQSFSWSQNVLQRTVQLFDIKLKQATTQEAKQMDAIKMPGAYAYHVKQILNTLYGAETFEGIHMSRVNPSYLNRQFTIVYILFTLIMIVAFIIGFEGWLWFIMLIATLILVSIWYWYHKFYFGANTDYIYIKSGIFGLSHTVLPIHKIQSIHLHQSPFERKRNLTSLEIVHASDTETIPFIPIEIAHKYINLFLKKVESSKDSWM